MITALMRLASRSKSEYELMDSRQLAVELLAGIAPREGIPLFLKNIEYKQPVVVPAWSRLNGYPCAQALTRIGMSAIRPMVEHLQSSPPESMSDTAVELYARVFYGIGSTLDEIHGPEEVLNLLRARVQRAVYKENLQRVVSRCEEIRLQTKEP
jgi:hypothetical protein